MYLQALNGSLKDIIYLQVFSQKNWFLIPLIIHLLHFHHYFGLWTIANFQFERDKLVS